MFKQYIYYFISVVEQGNFSAAAKKHYLSQSAISQQITKLQHELGFKLFDRQNYVPTLTKEGEQYYKLCKQLDDYYQKEYKKITEMTLKKENKIIIGITSSFEKSFIPIVINRFKKQYQVSFDVKVVTLQDCIKQLKDGTIDVGFGLVNDFRYVPNLNYYNILSSHVCVVTSLNHRLSQNKLISINDIKDEPIVVLSKKVGNHFYEDFMNAFELDGIHPNIVKEVDNQNDFILAIQLEEGIGFSAFEVISENDNVKAIPLENSHHHADYAIGYYRNNPKELVPLFVNEVNNYFKDYKQNL